MRRLFPILAALAACSTEQPLEPTRSSAPALAAGVTQSVVFLPVDAEVFLSCANDGLGEVLHITGTLQEAYHLTQSASGQTSFQFRLQGINVTGVGLTSGKTYDLVGGPYPHQWGSSLLDNSGQMTFGEMVTAIVVERGNGEIGTFRYLLHATVNANGEAVSTVDHFDATCF